MKCVLFVLGVLALLVSIQPHAVHGRAFRSTKTEESVVVPGREGEAVGVADSASNSFKRMAFRLASGPSRKGPGH
ncbi:hypothetical protein F3Y22_tig00111237pilonHSYRG00029 [Hibiscus syriacus]|uniref:Uncharacterized protein n=1 Tax=Hibiscus syriacus TaxID=106335 RepID=A0A6A2YUU9_HIBSY|nr:hypothetical protein F3Y22_tig00111237pilonHSYRG00029 [Hibiscus syriacus]